MFWTIGGHELPAEWTAEQQMSDTGNVCHHNIRNLADRELRTMLGARTLADFRTCDPAGLRVAELADVEPDRAPTPS